MKKPNETCAVTGREINEPRQAPGSSVNGNIITFCSSTCKELFDRYLVKFAEKRYPEYGQPAYSTTLNLKYKP